MTANEGALQKARPTHFVTICYNLIGEVMWAVMTANRKSGLYSCETVVVINRKRGREDLKKGARF